MVKEAGKLFGDYANRNVSRVPDRIDPASLARGTQVRVVEGPWNKALVSVLFPMPGEGDALLPAADVLARLLSGDDTALLPRSLRLDRHVVDDVGASAMAPAPGGRLHDHVPDGCGQGARIHEGAGRAAARTLRLRFQRCGLCPRQAQSGG